MANTGQIVYGLIIFIVVIWYTFVVLRYADKFFNEAYKNHLNNEKIRNKLGKMSEILKSKNENSKYKTVSKYSSSLVIRDKDHQIQACQSVTVFTFLRNYKYCPYEE